MNPVDASKSTGARFLLAAASTIILLAGLRAAAPFLVPLMLAVFLTIISLPVLAGLRRYRVPTPLAVLATVLVTFGVLFLLGWVATVSLGEIRVSLPFYLQRLQSIENTVLAALAARGIHIPAGLYANFAGSDRVVAFASGFLIRAAGLVSTTFIVVLYTVFMLSEATAFPAKLRTAIGRMDADLSRLAGMVHNIQRYLAIKTALSLTTGLLIGIWLWILGVDFPLFWGLVAFMLNYVPNVGSVVAAIPGVLVAFLQLGPGGALLSALGYLTVNFSLGNVLEPHLMGRGFGLSTLVVVISLVFWGWLWGPVGMLLSVPLTVMVRISLEHTEDFNWLAVLLGSGPDREAAAAAPAETSATGIAAAGG